MGFVADIFNLEIGLAVRNKLNVLMKFYNTVVKSDSLFNVERIDASYVKDATPTNTKFLRDDGTWQTVATNQNLEQTLANGNILPNGLKIRSADYTAFIDVIGGDLFNVSSSAIGTPLTGFQYILTGGLNGFLGVGTEIIINSPNGVNTGIHIVSGIFVDVGNDLTYITATTFLDDTIGAPTATVALYSNFEINAKNVRFTQEVVDKVVNIDANGFLKSTNKSINDLATISYVDGLVAGLLDDRGSYDASTNLFPSTGGSGTSGAILKGDIWYISVGGTLGGVPVTVGDSVRALVDSPAQTFTNWSVLETNIGYVPENIANKATTMTGNTTSNIVYLTAKAIFDWAIALFEKTSNKQNSLTADGTGTKYPTVDATNNGLDSKQATLVSGSNIRTVNGYTLLGSTPVEVGNGFKPIYSGLWRTIDFTNSPQNSSSSYLGAVYWIPYLIGRTHTVTDIGLDIVVAQASSNIRLAIYSDLNGAPNTLIEESGNLPSTTTGLKSYTFISPITLNQSSQVVWLGFQVSSSTVQIRTAATSINSIYRNGLGQVCATPYQTQSFGAFPTTATPTFPASNNVPLICLKAQ